MFLPSTVCLVQEAIGTSGACCRCSFPCYQLILCTRLCVHDSRHAAHNGSRKSHVSISSHSGVCVCPWKHGCLFWRTVCDRRRKRWLRNEASRRTAEVAQQVARACPAGIDVEEIGRLEKFSGDSDLNGRVSSMPWSQWSLTVRRYLGGAQPDGDPVSAAGRNKRGRSDHH